MIENNMFFLKIRQKKMFTNSAVGYRFLDKLFDVSVRIHISFESYEVLYLVCFFWQGQINAQQQYKLMNNTHINTIIECILGMCARSIVCIRAINKFFFYFDEANE